jgi:hypothetical protein
MDMLRQKKLDDGKYSGFKEVIDETVVIANRFFQFFVDNLVKS